MKPLAYHLFTELRFIVLALLTLGLFTGCSKKNDVTTQATCKLTSTTYLGSGIPLIDTREYAADGQLKSVSSSAGSKTSYAYDANGYLSAVTNVNNNGSIAGTSQVEFTNGLVTKLTSKNGLGTIVLTTQYEYDATGSLTKYVEQYVGGSTYTYTYSAGKQIGYVNRSLAGIESQPYTFENGLVKKYVSGTLQYTYDYDTQGRRTRYETYTNGQLTGYTVYEYTDGMAAEQAQAPFKGVPGPVVSGANQNGANAGLESKRTYYTVSSANVPTKFSETATTYTKNASGFPIEATTSYREYTAAGGVSYTSTYQFTYQYTGCP